MSLHVVTIGDATLYRGDALEMLAELAPGAADAVITDPPYSSGGQFRGDRAGSTKAKYLSSASSAQESTHDFGGDNRDQRSFSYWSALWAAAALRASKPGSPAIFFTDWRQLPVSTDYLQAGGWVWRGIAPWVKSTYRPQMGRFGAQCEYVVWGSAGPMPVERGVGCLPGFFEFAYPQGREHVTQKPLDLMEAIVVICQGGGGRARSLHGLRHDGRRGDQDRPALHRLRAEPGVLRHRVSPHRGSAPAAGPVRRRPAAGRRAADDRRTRAAAGRGAVTRGG